MTAVAPGWPADTGCVTSRLGTFGGTVAGIAGSRCSTARPRRCSRSDRPGCGATGPWSSHDERRDTGMR